MKTFRHLLLVSTVVVLVLPRPAQSQVVFTGASGTSLSWFDSKNWDGGHLPTSDDNAVLNLPSATDKNPVVIDNSADPAYANKIATCNRLMVGDGNTSFLVVKSVIALSDGLRVGNSDSNKSGQGTVTQVSGVFDPGSSPQIGTTSGLTGTYLLEGGFFSVGDTSLYIGGNATEGAAPGRGSFIISGGKFDVGSRVVFGNGGGASFTVIGSKAQSIGVEDQFNENGAGKVDLNVQIDQKGLTPITTSILGLPGITVYPSFAQGVAPRAGTWTVVAYTDLAGASATPLLGKSVDATHWSVILDRDACKLNVSYKP